MAIRIQRDHALAPLTTLEVGGSADVYVRAETEGQVVEAIWYAQRAGLALTVLGGGSNSLVADAGVRGVVLQPAVMGRRVRAEGDDVAVEVGAGVPWDELVAWSVSAGLCGLKRSAAFRAGWALRRCKTLAPTVRRLLMWSRRFGWSVATAATPPGSLPINSIFPIG